ncbi:MAG: hypothetical protein NUV53_03635 [Patescibacteria group bacterium]|nr:hypothetical protein [Patescibacteria group bacterium]
MIRDLSNLKREETQNFATQLPVERTREPSGFYVALALDVLTVACALWIGLSYRTFLDVGTGWAGILLSGGGFSVCLALGLYLTKSITRRILVILGSVAGLFLFTASSINYAYAGSAAFIVFFLILWGEAASRAHIANGIEVRVMQGVRPLLAKSTTALIVAGLLLYIPYWSPAGSFFSQGSFNGIFQSTGEALHRFYGEIDFVGTFDSFTTSIARHSLLSAPDFRRLPTIEQEATVRNLAVTVKENLSNALVISPEEAESPMHVIWYKVILQSLAWLEDKFGVWFIAIWLLSLFGILRGIGVLFYWCAGLITMLFFQTLLVTKVITTKGETCTREVVEYVQ